MPKTTTADRYSQRLFTQVLQTGANTITFAEIVTGHGTLDKVGMIIQRLEYQFFYNTTEIATQLLLASDDFITGGICTSNQITNLAPSQAAVIDAREIRADVRSAVGFSHYTQPFIMDFTSLAGGGKLCLPKPLYVACDSKSLASAVLFKLLVHFVEVQLSDSDWMELVEATRLLT